MIRLLHRKATVGIAVVLIGGLVACTGHSSDHSPDSRAYQSRRDEYRRTLTARQERGENVLAAEDSALHELETLLRPLVAELSAPWIKGRGRLNLQELLP